ncbi:protein kinase [Streptomyces sp. NPDC059956]|uniref:protein kinase domain-containing protein n=1 Tax=Streptomyces sp. NPDC059956 TaxID=3347015 RepID=UPI0036488D9A
MRDLEPGDPRRIANYTIEHLLGQGGMGRVYLGRSRGGREFAVKVIPTDRVHDPRVRARFRREAEVAGKVGGVHTPALHAADPDGTTPWIATVYVPGPTLRDRIGAEGRLDLAGLGRLGAALAEALVAFHGAGIIHRDLKPDNIIMSPDGPVIIDFGIAHGPDTTRTATGQVSGTAGFIAPEAFQYEEVSPACDVFAFGAVMVHAAGGLPFDAAHGYAPTEDDLPDVSALPPELRQVVTTCLARDPAARPTADDLLALLAPLVPTTGPLRPQGPPAPRRLLNRIRPSVDPAASTADAVPRTRPRTAVVPAQPGPPHVRFRIAVRRRVILVVTSLVVLCAPPAAMVAFDKPYALIPLCLLGSAFLAFLVQARPVELTLSAAGVSFAVGALTPIRTQVLWATVTSLELDVRKRPLMRITTNIPSPKPPAGRDVYVTPQPYTVHHVVMPGKPRISACPLPAGNPRSTASLVTTALALFAPQITPEPLSPARSSPSPNLLSVRPRAVGALLTLLPAAGQLTAVGTTQSDTSLIAALASGWALLIWLVPLRPWRVTLNHRGLRIRGRRRTGRRIAAALPWADIQCIWEERDGRCYELHVLLRAEVKPPPGLRVDTRPDGTRVRIPLPGHRVDPLTRAARARSTRLPACTPVRPRPRRRPQTSPPDPKGRARLQRRPPSRPQPLQRDGSRIRWAQLIPGVRRAVTPARATGRYAPGRAAGAPARPEVTARLWVPRPIGRPRTTPDVVLPDKAYSSRAIRTDLRLRGIRAVIPQPSDQVANRNGGHPLRHGTGVAALAGALRRHRRRPDRTPGRRAGRAGPRRPG